MRPDAFHRAALDAPGLHGAAGADYKQRTVQEYNNALAQQGFSCLPSCKHLLQRPTRQAEGCADRVRLDRERQQSR